MIAVRLMTRAAAILLGEHCGEHSIANDVARSLHAHRGGRALAHVAVAASPTGIARTTARLTIVTTIRWSGFGESRSPRAMQQRCARTSRPDMARARHGRGLARVRQ